MRAELEGRSKPRDEVELTAYTLELLGIAADEAREIAKRPLPLVPDELPVSQQRGEQ